MSDSSGSNSSSGKTFKEIAQDKLNSGNASQLGDPVSMKAETADSHPTEEDRGAKGVVPERKTGGTSPSESGNGGAIDNDKAKSGSGNGNVGWDKIEEAGREGANEEGKPPAGEAGGKGGKREGRKTLAESYQESNKSMLGDPVSLKAEGAKSEPTEEDRGAMSAEERKKRGSKL